MLFRALGDTQYSADTLNSLGRAHAALGRAEGARTAWREALELYRRQGRDTDAQRVQRQLDALTHGDQRTESASWATS
ncbi:tetratricopeptide repeat protein [Actinosynnema sp. CS-041913]|uniref:tetratricopeptide repeat protein n=1 Tax=Actinosynnema sp. CS-041913 TaxID=3239917 RepID=UPI003D8DF27D